MTAPPTSSSAAACSKDDPRTEAYGTVDEAVSALGLARAELSELQLGESGASGDRDMAALSSLVERLQRELFVVGAEIATGMEHWDRLQSGVTRVDEQMVVGVEEALGEYEHRLTLGNEFVLPGATRLSAALDLARTVTRRAERRAVTLNAEGLLAGEWLVPYLNRVADLLWILARAAEDAASRPAAHVPRRLGAAQGK